MQPNNRLRVFDPSLASDPSELLIDPLVNTKVWSVESTSKWITAEDETGRYDYDYKTLDNNSWGITKK